MVSPPERQENADHPTLSTALLQGVQELDSGSWSRLVGVYAPIVYRWCRTSGVPDADAADVVQNVFASVARGIPGFQRQKQVGSFRSWLATITRNRVRDHFRRRAKQEVAVGGTAAWQQLQHQPDELESTICPDNIDDEVNRSVLNAVRDEFEEKTWNAFWLTAVEGQVAADVSSSLGISISSVYQAKSRVLRRLRQRLDDLPK